MPLLVGKFDKSKEFDYENGFYLTSKPYRLGNIIAHYELYKRIVNLPGDLIELGVFKGSSLIQFATFRELLENENSRKIVGFDMFGSFPENGQLDSDKRFAQLQKFFRTKTSGTGSAPAGVLEGIKKDSQKQIR